MPALFSCRLCYHKYVYTRVLCSIGRAKLGDLFIDILNYLMQYILKHIMNTCANVNNAKVCSNTSLCSLQFEMETQ